MIYNVGLTGGIASGKSTVAHLFAQHGVGIIDADVVAREIIFPGESTYKTIVAYFGKDIVAKDSNIDRTKLRQIVFNDPAKRLWLEKLLHPLIRERMMLYSRQATSPYCVQVIPLLIETLPYPEINRILVVDVSVETQIERLRKRDHLDEVLINKMLQAQISREERLEHADDILVNEGDLDTLADAVEKLHKKYLELF